MCPKRRKQTMQTVGHLKERRGEVKISNSYICLVLKLKGKSVCSRGFVVETCMASVMQDAFSN